MSAAAPWCKANNPHCHQITTTSSGIYTLSDPNNTGALFVGGYEVVGVNGTGTFNQTGGSNILAGGGAVSTKAPGTPYNNSLGVLFLGFYGNKGATSGGWYGSGVGTYNLSGGLLTGNVGGTGTSGYEVIGQSGTGIFTQSGGTNAPVNGFYVGGTKQALFGTIQYGGTGTYTLSNGLLTAANITGGVENIGQGARGPSRRRAEPTSAPRLISAVPLRYSLPQVGLLKPCKWLGLITSKVVCCR